MKDGRHGSHSKKYAPHARPAVARGIPVAVVDALVAVSALDEEVLTKDARLLDDLGLDELDIVELAMALNVSDDHLIEDGTRVSDLMAAYEHAEARR
jgi:acyl carrier protein